MSSTWHEERAVQISGFHKNNNNNRMHNLETAHILCTTIYVHTENKNESENQKSYKIRNIDAIY